MAVTVAALAASIQNISQTTLVNSLESQIDAILGNPQKALETALGKPRQEYWVFRFDGYLTKAGKEALIAKYVNQSAGWKKMTVNNSKDIGEAPGTISITLYPFDPDGSDN
jgi:hypothetical protein